ncbi:MAG: glycogen synthase [Parachlamydiales bacterium]|nr:glycogen synthase [Parachlamydiales bacterium]
MHIVHAAAEFAPFASVGGLGEVVHGLSREQVAQGMDVKVFLPCHSCIVEKGFLSPSPIYREENFSIYAMTYEKVPIFLWNSPWITRKKIYGYNEDPLRFSAFCSMIFSFLQKQSPIDVLHIHDWHTALLAPLCKKHPLPIKKICLSIHNFSYQGASNRHQLYPPLVQQLSLSKKVNPLKEGVKFADEIIPVSPTYAREIFTKPMGAGLDRFLFLYKKKVTGILNGIDQDHWNPATDKALFAPFSSNDPLEKIVQSKRINKEKLLQQCHMPLNQGPLVGNIGRLVEQKGLELIEYGLRETLKLGGQFILLGSSPSRKVQQHFEQLKKKYRKNPNVRFFFFYDGILSRQIYSACDFLLIPSVFEPCGLTQIIGFRYGAIPIARKTGGLSDTIFDQDDPIVPEEKKSGYLFEKYSKKELLHTLKRAFHAWYTEPHTIRKLMVQNIHLDYSWKQVADKFLQLYQR